MYIDGLNEEFAPPSEAEDGSDAKRAEPRSYRDSTPEPTFESSAGPLSPEEEERVRRQHERYMRNAPVPGYGAADSSALEAAGFQVRTTSSLAEPEKLDAD